MQVKTDLLSGRTFGPKGQFFPIFLEFLEKKYPSVIHQNKLTFRAKKTVVLGKIAQKNSLLFRLNTCEKQR